MRPQRQPFLVHFLFPLFSRNQIPGFFVFCFTFFDGKLSFWKAFFWCSISPPPYQVYYGLFVFALEFELLPFFFSLSILLSALVRVCLDSTLLVPFLYRYRYFHRLPHKFDSTPTARRPVYYPFALPLFSVLSNAGAYADFFFFFPWGSDISDFRIVLRDWDKGT